VVQKVALVMHETEGGREVYCTLASRISARDLLFGGCLGCGPSHSRADVPELRPLWERPAAGELHCLCLTEERLGAEVCWCPKALPILRKIFFARCLI